jgi:hypothetical protein
VALTRITESGMLNLSSRFSLASSSLMRMREAVTSSCWDMYFELSALKSTRACSRSRREKLPTWTRASVMRSRSRESETA